MLYDYMDEYDQQCHLLEKIEDIIRKFNFDEDIGLMTYHRDMIKAIFFDTTKLNNNETKERYKREFNGHDYVYRIIYENNNLRKLQRKIKYGYFNERTYEDFNKEINKVLEDIQVDFEIIFDSEFLFGSFDELKQYFNC